MGEPDHYFLLVYSSGANGFPYEASFSECYFQAETRLVLFLVAEVLAPTLETMWERQLVGLDLSRDIGAALLW